MGRYYFGDIEGKFWFAVQASDAADRFGVTGTPPNYLNYYFDTNNLQSIRNEIGVILKNLGEYKTKLDEFFSKQSWYNDEELKQYLKVDEKKLGYLLSEYADLHLGEKILKCVEENGTCEFEAEL